MKTNLALYLVAGALTTACAGNPSWDSTVFPAQPEYSRAQSNAIVAELPIESTLIESRGE